MKLQTTHSINYNLVFRIVFISILVCVCFVASSFMVLESSEFFERFYTGNSKNFGFISAFLNEVFLVIMASVWVPAIQKGEKKSRNKTAKFSTIACIESWSKNSLDSKTSKTGRYKTNTD